MNHRLLILSACAMTVLATGARHMSPAQAWQRALASNEPAARRMPAATSPSPVMTVHSPEGEACVYLFNFGTPEEAKFVLLPSEDSAMPILAYGDGMPTDGKSIPPAMQEWMEMYALQLSHAAADGLAPYEASASSVKEEIEPLLTCNWDQLSPYNLLTPAYNINENCATGCVATAIAQVMHYHQYPPKGIGSHSYTDEINGNEVTLSADFGNTEYKWADMLDTYSGTYSTEEQQLAVSRLMADIGIAINMDYAINNMNASGVVSAEIYPRLTKHFGYSASLVGDHKEFHTEQGWVEKVYNNLKECGPLVYSGNNGQSGHCFVCDGYKDGMFHFNWGWSGAYNGYFALNALTPGPGGTGAGSGKYSLGQFALFGMCPPQTEDKGKIYVQAQGNLSFNSTTYAIPTDIKAVLRNSTAPGFYNNHPGEPSTIQFGLMFTDKESGKYYVLPSEPIELEYKNRIVNFDVEISQGEIPAGEYIMRPAVRPANEGKPVGEWSYISTTCDYVRAYDVSVYNNYISINSAAAVEEGEEVLEYTPRSYQLKATDVVYSGKTETDAEGTLTATLTNNQIEYEGRVSINLINSEGNLQNIGRTQKVSVSADGKTEVSATCKLPSQEGKYFLVLTDFSGTHFYEQPIEISKSTTGIGNIKTDDAKLTLSPNPASGYTFVEGIEAGTSIEIYDLTGRIVSRHTFDGTGISLEGMPAGIYLVCASGSTTRLIVK